ncbi:D-alanyl-D-alanine carboxypeptidase [Arsukibacterium ikkense]|uniref:D-alanyl-D-alanine carboxypeptidase n=1 Tax=Arsukibacterium ikkense TaxID=336831 RepID=A0A0M2V6B7_9GAMM|nr:M15 family metallopeptidase [Arsukibacterium ikkense]KKO46171.1 D-alanyl-D-alanine carboxypeptidase [Arsukibacterium ikkense]
MKIAIPDADILTGCSDMHLVTLADGMAIHHQMQTAWHALLKAAAAEGIDIKIASAFRGFQRQAAIWQAKCSGLRPVYDLTQQQVAVTNLTGLAKLQAIMLYSALPGASRHHWGTEVDVYDGATVADDYQPQLIPGEYQADGPFARLNHWLGTEASRFGFFRPYQHYRGGVAAEPWHLSYAPVATTYQQAFTLSILRQCLLQNPIAEQDAVLANLPQLYRDYIINICQQPLSVQANAEEPQ